MMQAIFEWEQRRPSYGRFSKAVQAKRKKKGFVALSLPEDGCFCRSCLPMQPFESEFNGEQYCS